MCHDMCKCFGRVGGNREGMEAMRLSVSLREGSDGSRIAAHVDLLISIHAPTKGATRSEAGNAGYADISIHAPVKGATAKITKTIPDDFHKINNYNNRFA